MGKRFESISVDGEKHCAFTQYERQKAKSIEIRHKSCRQSDCQVYVLNARNIFSILRRIYQLAKEEDIGGLTKMKSLI